MHVLSVQEGSLAPVALGMMSLPVRYFAVIQWVSFATWCALTRNTRNVKSKAVDLSAGWCVRCAWSSETCPSLSCGSCCSRGHANDCLSCRLGPAK